MLSAEDHPGIFYFLVGMIVLVMAGVGLSLVVDKRMKFSSSYSALERDLAAGDDELQSLKYYYEGRQREFETSEAKLRNGANQHTDFTRKAAALTKRKSELVRTLGELQVSVPALENQFAAYRAEYRRQTWSGAVGQKLGTLVIRGGREYQEAVITRVTDVGLEIRHKDGIARVQAPDLDQKWQDRFQWSDEERRTRLKEELANHESIAPPPPPPEAEAASEFPARQSSPEPQSDQAKLAELRLKVGAWKNKVSRLRAEKSEAMSQASYAGQTSVSGSLETWKAKAARTTAELIKAQAELGIAKSRLAAASPDDPLLRAPSPSEDGY